MAKYSYVSSEKMEESTKIYPLYTIQEFTCIENQGVTFTVWLETLPRFEANDFEFSIDQ